MSISTQRNLSQLKAECKALGLTVKQSGPRESKTDYILALRQYHLSKMEHIPKGLELMLQIDSPMLCKRYPELNEQQQNEIWTSKNWMLEEKEDGNRMVYMFTEDGFDSYSRNISVTDYLPESYGDKIHTNADLAKIKDHFVLDSEVVSSNPNICTYLEGKKGCITETQLQATTAILALNKEQSLEIQREFPLVFKTFDCIWWNGVWLLDKPFYVRRQYLEKAIAQLKEAGFNVKKPFSCYNGDRKAFYNALVKAGHEGCVAKQLNSPYVASNTRSAGYWVKIKRTMSESLKMAGLGDTVDGWISGFEPADENKSQAGLVGSIDISTYIREPDGTLTEHVIARVSNLSLETKKAMTELVDGKPSLKAEYYGRVVECDGQAVSAREKRLKHAVMVRWRPDKSMDTCIMDRSFLESMVL